MFKKLMIIPAAFFAFACSGNDKKVDDALNADLATAAQAQPYMPLASQPPQPHLLSRALRRDVRRQCVAPLAAVRTRFIAHQRHSGRASSSTPSVTPPSAPSPVEFSVLPPAGTR